MHSISFFTPIPLSQLEALILSHQERFNIFLEDTFSDDELSMFEILIDALGAVYVQPLLVDLAFDDFYSNPEVENEQRSFFNSCKSSVCFENLPFLEANPFQVTYFLQLFKNLGLVLIDQGGVHELMFTPQFLKKLSPLKNIDSLITIKVPKVIKTLSSTPVDPIDFLVLDVYKEIDRIKVLGKLDLVLSDVEVEPRTLRKLLLTVKNEKLTPIELLKKSGLHPKDFDDGLERLKFWLKKFD